MKIPLLHALRAGHKSTIAFTGSGGKSSAMFQLARELSRDVSVIVTATAHLGIWQIPLADHHVILKREIGLQELEHEFKGVTLLISSIDGDRTLPLDSSTLDQVHEYCKDQSIPLLIEADGSRQKPLKAWAAHEPPIPTFVDQVVEVAGFEGLGKPLSADHVHRPEIFSELSGLTIGEVITPEALTRVLMDPEGGQKNIPKTARKTLLLNQAETAELQAIAQGMSQALLKGFDSIIVASLKEGEIFAVHEPVAGIVLAAGESKRFGQPKQLLDWKGQPFVRAVASKALEVGLSPVIVVTGANSERVESALVDLDVKIAKNSDWKNGQGRSMRTAAQILEDEGNVGAAIFLLTDQPQVTTSILRALVEKHAEGLYPVVAPLVIDQRANPVLFDRVTFPDLKKIEGDVGGRSIFHKYHVEYLPWHDDRLLLDVDTPEQYQRLISDETL